MPVIKKNIAKLAGKREPTTINLNQTRSILIKPIGDAIGDAIAHTAHLNQLKQANPKLKIGVLVTNRNRTIFAMSGLADVLLEDKFSTYLKERKNWDLYLDFMPTYTSRSILCDKLLEPASIIVFNKKHKKYYNTDCVKNYSFHCPQPPNAHISDYLNHSVLAKFLSSEDAKYQLQTDKSQNFAHIWDKPFKVLLAPEGSLRKIPEQELGALLNMLPENFLAQTCFIGTVVPDDQGYWENLKQYCNPNIKITEPPKLNLEQYIQLVASADLVIAVDGGVVHIAAALQKSLLAFYARNMDNFYRWQPKVDGLTPYKVILSNTESQSNNDTFDFPMKEAAEWINNFYQKYKSVEKTEYT